MASVTCSLLLLVMARGREPRFHQEILNKPAHNSILTYKVSLCILNGHICCVAGRWHGHSVGYQHSPQIMTSVDGTVWEPWPNSDLKKQSWSPGSAGDSQAYERERQQTVQQMVRREINEKAQVDCFPEASHIAQHRLHQLCWEVCPRDPNVGLSTVTWDYSWLPRL